MSAPALRIAPALPSAPAPAPKGGRRTRDLRPLVRAAARGNDAAWEELVRYITPIARGTIARMRLAPADMDDVIQTTWLRAFAQLHTLRNPEAFVGWLLVIARREALMLLQRRTREVLVDDFAGHDEAAEDAIDAAGEHERREALRAAIERLPAHERRLLARMLAKPEAGYAEIGAQLAIPIGSIGPTRQRAFARLRGDMRFVTATTD